jgi:quinol monooxygenase YgiN
MYEVWASQEALAAHFETPHLKQLAAQCAELLDGPMDLRPFTPVALEK